MTRIPAFGLLLGAVLAFILNACGEVPPPRPGTAAGLAVDRQARAASLLSDADAAEIDAARSQAQADRLAEDALRSRTAEAISAAADARVQAAADRAVATALRAVAGRAEATATQATKDAAAAETILKNEQEQRERQSRAWWIAAMATAAAACGAALLLGLSAPLRWLLLPAVVAGGGWALYAFALWATWIAAAAAGILLLVIVAAAVAAVRHVVRVEWPDAVDSLATALPDAAETHNTASLARQRPWVRQVLDWLLGSRPAVATATAAGQG